MCEIFTPGEGYSSYSEQQILEMRKQLYMSLGPSIRNGNDSKQEKIPEKNETSEEEDGAYLLGLA